MKINILIISLLILTGCNNATQTTHNTSTPQVTKTTLNLDSQNYINRIGNRLILGTQSDVEYNFKIVNSDKISITVDDNRNINISKGLLRNLKNEAELSAVLSIPIVKVTRSSTKVATNNYYGISINIMNLMVKAGYNPNSLIYFTNRISNQPNNISNSWSNIFSSLHYKKSQELENKLKDYCSTLPRGLQTGSARYNRIILGNN